MLVGLIALTLSASFAGAAFYINFVEQPARLQLDDRNLLEQWKPSYARGYRMQSILAATSGMFGLAAGWMAADWRWAIGAVLMLVNWPYTLLCILPLNNRLNAIPPDQAGPNSRAMLVRWNQLHAIRTFLGTAGALAYLWVAAY